MGTARSHATAPSMAAMISGDGFSTDMRKRVTVTLSAPAIDGGSYLRAHVGASVFSSCWAHQPVSLPS